MNQNHKNLSKKNVKKSFILAMAALAGCCSPLSKQSNKDMNRGQNEAQLTLIGKRIQYPRQAFNPEGTLYFDTDGILDTAEIIGKKSICCPASDAMFFNAKIGDKKSESQWRKQLSHKNEENCYNRYFNLIRVCE